MWTRPSGRLNTARKTQNHQVEPIDKSFLHETTWQRRTQTVLCLFSSSPSLVNASEGASLSPSLDLGAAWHSQSLISIHLWSPLPSPCSQDRNCTMWRWPGCAGLGWRSPPSWRAARENPSRWSLPLLCCATCSVRRWNYRLPWDLSVQRLELICTTGQETNELLIAPMARLNARCQEVRGKLAAYQEGYPLLYPT